MNKPGRYRVIPEVVSQEDAIEAMQFDGTAECAGRIREWVESRFLVVSPYRIRKDSLVEVAFGTASGRRYLVFDQPSGLRAAAADGDWLVIESGFMPWLMSDFTFRETYVEMEG